MIRIPVFALLMIALALPPAATPAGNPIVGAWQCVSSSAEGEQFKWVLTVAEQDGKLAGTLAGDMGSFPISDAKLTGDAFTFNVTVGSGTYAIECKVAGDSFAGNFSGPESRGTIKGTRQSS
jgi:hypothetical protein